MKSRPSLGQSLSGNKESPQATWLSWQSSELHPSLLVLKPALIPCSLCSCEQRVAVQLKWVRGEWECKATTRAWHEWAGIRAELGVRLGSAWG